MLIPSGISFTVKEMGWQRSLTMITQTCCGGRFPLDIAKKAVSRVIRAKTWGERDIVVLAVAAARRHGILTWKGKIEKRPVQIDELPVIEVLWVNLLVNPDGHIGIVADNVKRHIVSYSLLAIDHIPPNVSSIRWVDTLNRIRVVTSSEVPEVIVGPVDTVHDNYRF